MSESVLIAIVVCLALIGIVALVIGAIALFSYASEQGFIGIAAYIACWVFLAPIIATISTLIGLFFIILLIVRIFSNNKD